MLDAIAQTIVVAVGGALILVCLAGMVAPGILLGTVDRVMNRRAGMVLAVLLRLVLGVSLLLVASLSRWPVLFQALGWLTLAAAVALPFFGRRRVSSVVDWVKGFHPVTVRLWMALGLSFGAVLLYGVSGSG